MDIKQVTNFNFTITADGVNFNFSIPSDSKENAIADLRKKLLAVVKELEDALNQSKAKSAN